MTVQWFVLALRVTYLRPWVGEMLCELQKKKRHCCPTESPVWSTHHLLFPPQSTPTPTLPFSAPSSSMLQLFFHPGQSRGIMGSFRCLKPPPDKGLAPEPLAEASPIALVRSRWLTASTEDKSLGKQKHSGACWLWPGPQALFPL